MKEKSKRKLLCDWLKTIQMMKPIIESGYLFKFLNKAITTLSEQEIIDTIKQDVQFDADWKKTLEESPWYKWNKNPHEQYLKDFLTLPKLFQHLSKTETRHVLYLYIISQNTETNSNKRQLINNIMKGIVNEMPSIIMNILMEKEILIFTSFAMANNIYGRMKMLGKKSLSYSLPTKSAFLSTTLGGDVDTREKNNPIFINHIPVETKQKIFEDLKDYHNKLKKDPKNPYNPSKTITFNLYE